MSNCFPYVHPDHIAAFFCLALKYLHMALGLSEPRSGAQRWLFGQNGSLSFTEDIIYSVDSQELRFPGFKDRFLAALAGRVSPADYDSCYAICLNEARDEVNYPWPLLFPTSHSGRVVDYNEKMQDHFEKVIETAKSSNSRYLPLKVFDNVPEHLRRIENDSVVEEIDSANATIARKTKDLIDACALHKIHVRRIKELERSLARKNGQCASLQARLDGIQEISNTSTTISKGPNGTNRKLNSERRTIRPGRLEDRITVSGVAKARRVRRARIPKKRRSTMPTRS